MAKRRKPPIVTSPPFLIVGDTLTVEADTDVVVQVPFTLSRSWRETVWVPYRTQDGTAVAGDDYEHAEGSVVFLPGETEKMVTLVVYGDTNVEGGESFVLEFGPITPDYVRGNDSRDTNSGSRAVIIFDND